VDTAGNLAQQDFGDLSVGGILGEIDGDEQLLSLGVNITNINTTFVGEKDPVAL